MEFFLALLLSGLRLLKYVIFAPFLRLLLFTINYSLHCDNTILKFRLMNRGFFISILFLIIFHTCNGQIPTGYYDSANGLNGDALKTALNDIIDGHAERTYDQVKYDLRVTDEDPNNSNNIICLYTGWSYAKSAWDAGSEGWNREHVWSKSHGDFGNLPPAGTDLHHLRPADISVNSTKSNRDFDFGITEVIDASGPTDCYYDTYVWEPRDTEKGDVARMIFYMATRYEGKNSEVDLEIVDYVNTAGTTNEPFYGKLSTLLLWHASDPVDAWEIKRNNIIYTDYQNNRNPFIDHPEYVNLIWGSTNPEPSNHVTSFSAGSPTSSSITLTWNDNDGGDPADKFLVMINTTGTFVTPIDGVENNNDIDISDGGGQVNVSHGGETYTFTGLDANIMYYFEIYPYANFGTGIDYKTDGTIPSSSASTSTVNLRLIISEVADPANIWQSRFIELYNAGDTEIDFDAKTWYLSRQANGNSESWADKQLTGSISAGGTYTIAYSTSFFLSSYGFNADINSGYISGDGNDGYFLYSGGNHTTGLLVDAYGVIDVDGSGQDWEYTNSKAVRKHLDTIPSSNWQAEHWIINSSANDEHMTPDWHRITLSWTGTQSSSWENKANWSEGRSNADYPPDAGSKVTIFATSTQPIISSEAACDFIELDPGVILTISSGSLVIGH